MGIQFSKFGIVAWNPSQRGQNEKGEGNGPLLRDIHSSKDPYLQRKESSKIVEDGLRRRREETTM